MFKNLIILTMFLCVSACANEHPPENWEEYVTCKHKYSLEVFYYEQDSVKLFLELPENYPDHICLKTHRSEHRCFTSEEVENWTNGACMKELKNENR